MTPDAPLWRVFPWEAEGGAPFSASFVPPRQGAGRFGLPASPVLYLAETREHAVAERIQGFRGQLLEPFDLTDREHRLALVSVALAPKLAKVIADCCDPRVLARLGVRPDTLASRDVAKSRGAALAVFEQGYAGLRWWSSLGGDWHAIVLFMGRADVGALRWGTPEPLHVEHASVEAACASLGIRRWLPRRRR